TVFNEKIRKLQEAYRYVDFSNCNIFQIFKEKDKERYLEEIHENGILIIGKRSKRRIYFVEQGKFIKDSSGKEIVVNTHLTREEQKLLGKEQGKVDRKDPNDKQQGSIRRSEPDKSLALDGLIRRFSSK